MGVMGKKVLSGERRKKSGQLAVGSWQSLECWVLGAGCWVVSEERKVGSGQLAELGVLSAEC